MYYFKQLLLTILVFCTLGYSSAWAFDGHVLAQLNTDSVVTSDTVVGLSNDVVANADQSHEKNDSDIACDHCGHVSSHLVAIFTDIHYSSTISTSISLSNLSKSFHSFVISPDLKPPRV